MQLTTFLLYHMCCLNFLFSNLYVSWVPLLGESKALSTFKCLENVVLVFHLKKVGFIMAEMASDFG